MEEPYISIVNDRNYATSITAQTNGQAFNRLVHNGDLHYWANQRLMDEMDQSENIHNHPDLVKPLTPLNDLMLTLTNKHQVLTKDTGIMPPGLLYLSDNYIVFERPPAYQNIQVISAFLDEINYRKHNIVTMRLPIPWQVYIVNYVDNGNGDLYCGNVKMYFTNGPIQTLDDPVFLAPLNNFYGSGDLCRPMYDSIDDIERFPKNVAGVMQAAFDWIWNSGTNIDLTIAIVQMFNQFGSTMYDNTLFSYASEHQRIIFNNLAKSITFSTYYCAFTHQQMLFEVWENLSLDQVISLRWPNPMPNRTYYSDIRDSVELHYEAVYVNEDDMHYDENEDAYFQCGDSDCHCAGQPQPSMIDLARDQGVWPPAPMSLRESLQHMIEETHITTQSLMNPSWFTRDTAQRMIDYSLM